MTFTGQLGDDASQLGKIEPGTDGANEIRLAARVELNPPDHERSADDRQGDGLGLSRLAGLQG